MGLSGEAATPPYWSWNKETSSVTSISTETQTDSITVTLVSGETYEIVHSAIWSGSSSSVIVKPRIREDSSSGTQLASWEFPVTAVAHYYNGMFRAIYTATASGSKTFVVTGEANTGTCNRVGSSTDPSNLTVEKKL